MSVQLPRSQPLFMQFLQVHDIAKQFVEIQGLGTGTFGRVFLMRVRNSDIFVRTATSAACSLDSRAAGCKESEQGSRFSTKSTRPHHSRT
jgi:hypothetical protein